MPFKKKNKRQRRRLVRNEIDKIKKQLKEQDTLINRLIETQSMQVKIVTQLVKHLV